MAEIMPVITHNQNVFQAGDSMIGGTQDREFDGESQPWDIEDPTKEFPSDDESPEEVESITQTPVSSQKRSAAGLSSSSNKKPPPYCQCFCHVKYWNINGSLYRCHH
ncbi:hypothetical protein L218DRAFT_1010484 [Marasmius fiardii PR-910]|nr:hypothetical protein L218DRAFT_1010484 [Marasmius fiardii PR-910]